MIRSALHTRFVLRRCSMAITHLHSGHTVDFRRAPKITPAMKLVASVAALLFAFCAFVLPNDMARVITGIIALGFGVIGALPPMSATTKLRLLAWFAALLAIAGLSVAVFRA